MGRLIDTDTFETNLRKLDCESNNKDYRNGAADMLKAVYTILNIQPTAYDVEKVVEKVKDYRDLVTECYLREIVEEIRKGGAE